MTFVATVEVIHTTRHRQLLVLPGGAMLVDTPGLRELQIWEGDVDSAFSDIAELATQCRFNDCAHSSEPGCAVQDALESGVLDRALQELSQARARAPRDRAALELTAASRAKQRWRQRTRESRAARRYGKRP